MSQFGLQMPGGQRRRGSSLDVYGALAFVAVVFLLVACVVMFRAGQVVGPDGSAFGLQEKGQIKLKALK